MKSIITGVAGFIGSSLADQLLIRGQEVIGIDNLADNYDVKIKEKNLEGLLTRKNFKLIRDDIFNIDLSQYMDGVDHIFHQAALTGTKASWDNVEAFTRNNIFTTAKLLDAAKKAKIKKFIAASAAAVYGSLTLYPFKEAFPVKPLSPYAITKMKSEQLCQMYYKEEKLPVVILRYFTVYGPKQRPDMAVYNMIASALKGEEFIIFGDGKQERDHIFIQDAVNATIRAAEMGRTGEIYNVGTGTETSILGMIKIVEEVSGKKVKTRHAAAEKGDMAKTQADIEKLKSELAIVPGVDIKSGIQKQIDWMKKIL